MTNKLKRFFRPADIIIIAVLLIVSAVLPLIPKKEGGKAVIIKDGEIISETDLTKIDKPYTVTLDGGIEILFEKNAVSFVASDCANKLCIHAGKLTKAGDTAVCLPNKTLIRIKGKAVNDAVTG